MGFRKRFSPAILKTAEERLAGVKAIDPTLDLGNGLSVTDFEQMVTDFKAALDVYNVKLGGIVDDANALDVAEKALKFFNRRILAAIGSVYGYDSSEYEMAGGTRRSDRKRGTQNSEENGTSGTPEGSSEV